MFLEVKNIRKSFGSIDVLKGTNLEMDIGDHLVIRGASGSGKSTLLHLIAGLEPATSGLITVGGANIVNFNDQQLAHYRNRYVGLVFQFHYLLPSLNCLDNMLLPAKIGGVKDSEIEKRVLSLSKLLGVEHCLKKTPYELSGGEQQRVNVIRALSMAPKLLLCDEPTGNLDSQNSEKVINLILELAKDFSSTLIVVTHDKEIAKKFSKEAVMKDGILNIA